MTRTFTSSMPCWRLALAAATATAMVCGLSVAQAQSVYRSVGPDGKITFSDRAPAAAEPKSALPAFRDPASAAPAAQDASLSALPYSLRQTAMRFPVTLYTSADCAPCASARSLLQGRGVPFNERTVKSNEDIDALQRLSKNTSLPFATIGTQQLSGFSDVEWKQYLDAAGYPKQSQLPSNYQQPAAMPLVAIKRAENAPPLPSKDNSAETVQPRQPRQPLPTPSTGSTQSNPAGIRF